MTVKACSVCGGVATRASTRCSRHPLPPPRGRAHQIAARQTLAEEHTCWVCGLPATPGDPLVADHIVDRADGGPDVRSNMRAAHRSCNGRRAASRTNRGAA